MNTKCIFMYLSYMYMYMYMQYISYPPSLLHLSSRILFMVTLISPY